MSALNKTIGTPAPTESAPVSTSSFVFILSAEPTDEQADRLYARCADATLGMRSGVPYAAFDRDARSLPNAVESALRDVEESFPGIHVVRIEPDALVNASEIARRTGRTRASVSQLIEGLRGPGGFPPPRSRIGQRPLWEWLDVARWFATNHGTGTADVSESAFLGALNGALGIRHLAPHLTGDAERRTVARLITQNAQLLGAAPYARRLSPARRIAEAKSSSAKSDTTPSAATRSRAR